MNASRSRASQRFRARYASLRSFFVVCQALTLPAVLAAQSFNIDIGDPGSEPPTSYAAAGRAGHWISTPAEHLTTTTNLIDVHGNVTDVSLRQIGGLELLDENDPSISGDHALLMDDFLVTYDSILETCLFFDNLDPGTYEVLIYARMPDPLVESYTDIDQELGNPHSHVGGSWTGQHEELVTYSRHLAVVAAAGPTAGDLSPHSGIVPLANPNLGAALNAIQLLKIDLFSDGFESGTLGAWSRVASD